MVNIRFMTCQQRLSASVQCLTHPFFVIPRKDLRLSSNRRKKIRIFRTLTTSIPLLTRTVVAGFGRMQKHSVGGLGDITSKHRKQTHTVRVWVHLSINNLDLESGIFTQRDTGRKEIQTLRSTFMWTQKHFMRRQNGFTVNSIKLYKFILLTACI